MSDRTVEALVERALREREPSHLLSLGVRRPSLDQSAGYAVEEADRDGRFVLRGRAPVVVRGREALDEHVGYLGINRSAPITVQVDVDSRRMFLIADEEGADGAEWHVIVDGEAAEDEADAVSRMARLVRSVVSPRFDLGSASPSDRARLTRAQALCDECRADLQTMLYEYSDAERGTDGSVPAARYLVRCLERAMPTLPADFTLEDYDGFVSLDGVTVEQFLAFAALAKGTLDARRSGLL